MKLINVEEHYMSKNISDKIKKILSEQEGNVSLAVGDAAPSVTDLGETRITYMNERKIDTQVIMILSICLFLKKHRNWMRWRNWL